MTATRANTVTLLEAPSSSQDDFTYRVHGLLTSLRGPPDPSTGVVDGAVYFVRRVGDVRSGLKAIAKSRPTAPVDYVDIVGHAFPGWLSIGTTAGSASSFSALTAAPEALSALGDITTVLSDPPFHPGTIVRLIGCWVGAPRRPDKSSSADGTVLLHAVAVLLERSVQATLDFVYPVDFAGGFYAPGGLRSCWADVCNGGVSYAPATVQHPNLPTGDPVTPNDRHGARTKLLPGGFTFRQVASQCIANVPGPKRALLDAMKLYDGTLGVRLKHEFPSVLVAQNSLDAGGESLWFSKGGDLAIVRFAGNGGRGPSMFAFALSKGGFEKLKGLQAVPGFPQGMHLT